MTEIVGLWQKIMAKLSPYKGTAYGKLGGERGLRSLVRDFYHIMRTDPYAKDCFETHQGRDLEVSAQKLEAFLSGWLGGPPHYHERYGHPRLRMRHFPFHIGERESQQWLYCMEKALDKRRVKLETKSQMLEALKGVTTVIKNRD